MMEEQIKELIQMFETDEQVEAYIKALNVCQKREHLKISKAKERKLKKEIFNAVVKDKSLYNDKRYLK